MTEDTFRWVITGAVGIATLCILIMAVVALVMYRIATKLQGKVEDLTGKAAPIIDTVRELARENSPKVSAIATRAKEIADNAKDISDVAKDQAHRFAEVGRDIADRTKAQVARVDAAVDDTVDQVQMAGSNLKVAAMKPVREASGVLAGVKAAVSTYAQGRRPSIDHITQDEEMFI
jgi:tetrahydromethanopterin S-methyltransferase subunit F